MQMYNDSTTKCMMGAEGFSWCDTETLFQRDDHWFDWDSCSLCDPKDLKTRQENLNMKNIIELSNILALTTKGHKCKGECLNKWNNYETEAPRCEVAGGSKEYCTTCQGAKCPKPQM